MSLAFQRISECIIQGIWTEPSTRLWPYAFSSSISHKSAAQSTRGELGPFGFVHRAARCRRAGTLPLPGQIISRYSGRSA